MMTTTHEYTFMSTTTKRKRWNEEIMARLHLTIIVSAKSDIRRYRQQHTNTGSLSQIIYQTWSEYFTFVIPFPLRRGWDSPLAVSS